MGEAGRAVYHRRRSDGDGGAGEPQMGVCHREEGAAEREMDRSGGQVVEVFLHGVALGGATEESDPLGSWKIKN